MEEVKSFEDLHLSEKKKRCESVKLSKLKSQKTV